MNVRAELRQPCPFSGRAAEMRGTQAAGELRVLFQRGQPSAISAVRLLQDVTAGLLIRRAPAPSQAGGETNFGTVVMLSRDAGTKILSIACGAATQSDILYVHEPGSRRKGRSPGEPDDD